MACNRSVAFKAVELVLSAACLVFKRVTDDEARRQRLADLRLGREWPLYRAVAISIDGSVATNVVFGAYVLISLALLVGHLTGELGPQRWRMETFLLMVGAGGFVVAASMAYVTLDSVVPSLLDNAAVLGTLGLVTGLVFLADALMLLSARQAKPPPKEPPREPPKAPPAARHDKVTQTPAGEAYSRVYIGGPLKSSLRSPRRVQFPAPGAEATAARPPSPPPPPSSSSDDGSPSPPQRDRDDSPPPSRSRSRSPGPLAAAAAGAGGAPTADAPLRLPALGPAVPLQQRQRTLQVVGEPLEVRSSGDSALLDSLRALHAMDIPPPPRERRHGSPPRDAPAGGEKDRELAEEVQESAARAQHHRQLPQQREESPLSARELQLLDSGRDDGMPLDSSKERDLLQVSIQQMLAPLSPAERERLLLDSLRGSGKFRWGRRQQEQVSPPPHWGYDARVANRAHRDRESPSSPLDPGYVRHAASNWPVTPPSGSRTPRTPSQSPSGSESSGSPPAAGQTPGAAAGAGSRFADTSRAVILTLASSYSKMP
ncbi:BUD13 homolog [Schistocerca nitens]|uniref:BUD13 homolog n=1 Tax=Schistocerca nitens TaxID=7011 RepID=UPI0021181E18|nr:BUD13 homolog [Schistocerca nitens]